MNNPALSIIKNKPHLRLVSGQSTAQTQQEFLNQEETTGSSADGMTGVRQLQDLLRKLNEVFVEAGPNPFILEGQNELFNIKKLKNNSIVKIFNLNGLLIQKLTAKNLQVDGSRATWNGKELNGNIVTSGIYLYLAFTEDGKSVAGKIAVVRK